MATELNVRAKILITRELPGTGTLKAPGTIWWLGNLFHVRDESGLSVDDVLALASSPRGFGREPRTKEEFMDTRMQSSGVLDVYGERGAKQGTVVEDGVKWALDTEELLPAAELVLAGDVSKLKATGRGKLLGRDATEYTVMRQGGPGESPSRVQLMVAGAYVLSREVTDEKRAGARLRVETVGLDEGVVRAEDVRLR